jgi:hypothetical protein
MLTIHEDFYRVYVHKARQATHRLNPAGAGDVQLSVARRSPPYPCRGSRNGNRPAEYPNREREVSGPYRRAISAGSGST